MGARKDGIYEVDDTGAVVPVAVNINSPLGQQLMATSVSVAIASDQSAIPISAASLPLPTGASTAANQLLEIADLDSIDDKIPEQFIHTSAAVGVGTPAVIPVSGMGGMVAILGSDPTGRTFFFEASTDGGVVYTPIFFERSYLNTDNAQMAAGTYGVDAAPHSPVARLNVAGYSHIRISSVVGSGTWEVVIVPIGFSPEIPNVKLYSGDGQIISGNASKKALNVDDVGTFAEASKNALISIENVLENGGDPIQVAISDPVQVSQGDRNGDDANAWSVALSDNTGTGFVAVKPASTPAAAIDNALVVAISPNNTIPVTGAVTVSGPVSITDGITSPVAVKAAASPAVIADKALVVAVSPNNTIFTNLTQVGSVSITLGSKVSASSIPVVIASDQALSVTALQGGAPWLEDIIRVGGAAISLGQKISALSFPVVLPSDQIVSVTGPLTDTQLRATPVPVSGSISATVSATATEDNPTYTEAAASAFSQDLEGNLRTKISTLVSDNRELYNDGDTKPLSLNRSGQLRVTDESNSLKELIMLNTKIYNVLFLILNAIDTKSNYSHNDINSDLSSLIH